MKLFICIDDTDIIGSKGTGEIAEEIGALLQQKQLGQASSVSRHQLFVHPDIPYTSHNSSMCFELKTQAEHLPAITQCCIEHLLEQSAEGSDPGLAIATEEGCDWPRLIDYGQQAKKRVLTKALAYDLAKQLGVHLSEHGGSGDGIIGALAGIGLRKYGSDGRLKGQIQLPQHCSSMLVAELIEQTAIEQVLDLAHQPLSSTAQIQLQGKIKAVRWHGQSCLLVDKQDGLWHNVGRQQLKDY
ncbi:DNA-binding protein [Ferrimonas lipolytica]|uniref:DNA-binding protein n=1 Tax=Ferrimonas lipolytica TaxID=2724191 RepID=A0A6H1UDZ2_9GAMM|nr:DNA-binding protein [Ferrimonas lipolytica]QIZ77301.1 DNA-binding protein [Ferrimonas lipolytica]